MSMERRSKNYIWPTWITKILSGENHCEWAPWVKAHYTYTKRADPNENNLAQWKADHAAMVKDRAAYLTAEGWKISLEGQNKFNYKGKSATVGGCPDIVGQHAGGIVLVEDIKTGKARDADFWQVAIYAFLLPLVDPDFDGAVIRGAVVYTDRVRAISPDELSASTPLILNRIKATAGPIEPPRRPSASECEFCDIADCPDRMESSEKTAEGDVF